MKPIRWHFLYFTKAKYSSHWCTETLSSDILSTSKLQENPFPRLLISKFSAGACPRTPLKWSLLWHDIEGDHYLQLVMPLAWGGQEATDEILINSWQDSLQTPYGQSNVPHWFDKLVREQMYSRGKSMLKASYLASCIPEV